MTLTSGFPRPTIMQTTTARIIPKELVSSLRFPRQPLVLSESERSGILEKLDRATRLGNIHHGKCRIVFQDDEGLKAVETTIWTYDADNIVLKYGMILPISRVVSVEIP
jgi:hypothetical protein